MKLKVIFTDIEVDFLIQILNKFMSDNNITNFPLKNKLLLNENTFYVEEIELLYLYLKGLKQTIEKHLDNPNTNDDNLRLNYKGINHCLRKCRKALEEHDINLSEIKVSFDEFFNLFSNNFM